ncbi:hypothetical protein Dimus_016007 [Dionaea muscipula]
MPSVLHKNNKYKNYVLEIEESKKKDEERDQEIANLKILVARLMNGGGGNNHSSCDEESADSIVLVPSNTWVLLVLNWKLGAGTSLAYLTAKISEGDFTFYLKKVASVLGIRIGNECKDKKSIKALQLFSEMKMKARRRNPLPGLHCVFYLLLPRNRFFYFHTHLAGLALPYALPSCDVLAEKA